jgi:two-component system LytT family response regulator
VSEPGTRPLRVLVADDEPLARQRVLDLLRKEQDVQVVGEADNGQRTIDAIRREHPDLVFLDVQMPGKTGLDALREIGPEAMPATIFITAYDTHALEAFDLAAVDYLVKPFDDERFEQAFRRARRMIELKEVEQLRSRLLSVLQGGGERRMDTESASAVAPRGGYLERIPVEMRGKVKVVPVSEIEYIVASGPYAELFAGDRKYLIRESMQNLEDRLDPSAFIRVHRSVIVRIEQIATLHKAAGGDYEVELRNGRRLRVSRSRLEKLEKKLGLGA